MSDLRPVIDPAKRILSERRNMKGLLEGIENDPNEFEIMLTSFDNAVRGYNSLSSGELPAGTKFLRKLKLQVGTLPTTQDLLANPRSPACRSFVRSLHVMDDLMTRAEDERPEPYIGFHIWQEASSQQRLMGGIFQAYGLTIADLILGRGTPQEDLYEYGNTILDGLIEVMALNHNEPQPNPIFDAVKSIGWLDAKDGAGDYLFTQTIRAAAEST